MVTSLDATSRAPSSNRPLITTAAAVLSDGLKTSNVTWVPPGAATIPRCSTINSEMAARSLLPACTNIVPNKATKIANPIAAANHSSGAGRSLRSAIALHHQPRDCRSNAGGKGEHHDHLRDDRPGKPVEPPERP